MLVKLRLPKGCLSDILIRPPITNLNLGTSGMDHDVEIIQKPWKVD
jgi:hypothetical protein